MKKVTNFFKKPKLYDGYIHQTTLQKEKRKYKSYFSECKFFIGSSCHPSNPFSSKNENLHLGYNPEVFQNVDQWFLTGSHNYESRIFFFIIVMTLHNQNLRRNKLIFLNLFYIYNIINIIYIII